MTNTTPTAAPVVAKSTAKRIAAMKDEPNPFEVVAKCGDGCKGCAKCRQPSNAPPEAHASPVGLSDYELSALKRTLVECEAMLPLIAVSTTAQNNPSRFAELTRDVAALRALAARLDKRGGV